MVYKYSETVSFPSVFRGERNDKMLLEELVGK